jgi:molecular chaperone DnaK
VYQTEKVLREQGEKVSADERAAVEGPLSDLKKALEGNDSDAIRKATESLMSASQAFSQKLYEAAARDSNAAGTSASGASTGQDGGSAEDDDIVDAEIVDEG